MGFDSAFGGAGGGVDVVYAAGEGVVSAGAPNL